jgi:hypothetical protein
MTFVLNAIYNRLALNGYRVLYVGRAQRYLHGKSAYYQHGDFYIFERVDYNATLPTIMLMLKEGIHVICIGGDVEDDDASWWLHRNATLRIRTLPDEL